MSGQQVPAWKRLGLKLKQPADAGSGSGSGSDPVIGSRAVGHPSSGHGQPNKRKLEAPPPAHSPYSNGSKKPRTEGTALRKQKSVTFGDTPSKKDIHGSKPKTTPSKQAQQKPKGPAKKQPAPSAPDLQPALDYLRQWKSSRANWKFNKNHQSSLIKHVFDPETFPSADIDTFYQYIRDLKGFVRLRLTEAAMDVRNQDEAGGSAMFPEGTMDLDAKQATYQSVLAGLLEKQQLGSKRKSFHEVEYVATSQDGNVIIRRVVKRMRAEIVMDELSDSGETETSTTASSSETITASDTNNDAETAVERQTKAPEGGNRRRRKLRVSNMDDSSSSESESDSESDTSSSSSDSDDSDEDEDDEMGEGQNETSSSSSSSSESESSEESDSDDDSELADA